MSERSERLRRLALPEGGVIGLAIDHRDSLREAAARRWPASDAELTAFKRRVVDVLGDAASMILIDEELGGSLLAPDAWRDRLALAMPLESQGYESIGDGRVTGLLDEFGPAQAAARGADACKLLLPFRPDERRSSEAQQAVARRAVEACHATALPLILEPLVYRLASEEQEAYESAYADLVIETARRMAQLRPDLLKLQYPGLKLDAAASRALHEACDGVPWVLLGGGQEPGMLKRQLEDACRAGASGIIVGRSVWDPALLADPSESTRQVAETSLPILAGLRRIVEAEARPLLSG